VLVLDAHPVSCGRDKVSVLGFRLDWLKYLPDEMEAENQDSGHRSKFAGLKEMLLGKTADDLVAATVSLFEEIRELQQLLGVATI
jgi:hypothetical protein